MLAGCLPDPVSSDPVGPRLTARPGAPTEEAVRGLPMPLGLGSGRDGLLYVPTAYSPATPIPLLVVLHGAGGDAEGWQALFAVAEERSVALLAPESRGHTWDAIRGWFAADVTFLDQALAHVFRRVRVDPHRVCLAGFSDGASYGLSLGIANGDLFTRVVGWSPGFLIATEEVGKPPVFIAHGTEDLVLPIRLSRDLIVPALLERGYDVTFREFDGGHVVWLSIVNEALDWWL